MENNKESFEEVFNYLKALAEFKYDCVYSLSEVSKQMPDKEPELLDPSDYPCRPNAQLNEVIQDKCANLEVKFSDEDVDVVYDESSERIRVFIEKTEAKNYVKDSLELFKELFGECTDDGSGIEYSAYFDLIEKSNRVCRIVIGINRALREHKMEMYVYSGFIGDDEEMLRRYKKEADEYVMESDFYKAILPEDWKGFLVNDYY